MLCCAEWIDFPRDDIYDTSTGKFVPGEHFILKYEWHFVFQSLLQVCAGCWVRPDLHQAKIWPFYTLIEFPEEEALLHQQLTAPSELPILQAMAAAWRSAGEDGTLQMLSS